MKRGFSIFLAAAMLLSMTACGGNANSAVSSESASAVVESTAAEDTGVMYDFYRNVGENLKNGEVDGYDGYFTDSAMTFLAENDALFEKNEWLPDEEVNKIDAEFDLRDVLKNPDRYTSQLFYGGGIQPEKCHRPRENDDNRPYQIDHQWRRCREFLILHADLEIRNDIGDYHRQYLRVDQIAPFQERYLKSPVQLHKENKQESVDEYHHPVTPAEERRPDNLVVPIDPDDAIESCQKRNQYQGKSQLDQALVLLKLIHAFVFWFLPFYLIL